MPEVARAVGGQSFHDPFGYNLDIPRMRDEYRALQRARSQERALTDAQQQPVTVLGEAPKSGKPGKPKLPTPPSTAQAKEASPQVEDEHAPVRRSYVWSGDEPARVDGSQKLAFSFDASTSEGGDSDDGKKKKK